MTSCGVNVAPMRYRNVFVNFLSAVPPLFTTTLIGPGSYPTFPASSTTCMPYQYVPDVDMLSVKLPDADVPETIFVFIFVQLFASELPFLSFVLCSSTCFNALLSDTL